MKLTILGSGTSTGVPVPACKCEVCTSSDPRDKRMRTSAYISTDEGQGILIDTSPDLRTQALTYNIERVDAVLLTHAHADHIMGLDDVRGYNFVKKGPIPLYGSEESLSELRRIFKYIFSNEEYEGGLLPKITLLEINGGKPFIAAGVNITPLPLLHGRMNVLGFRIGSFAYATDCNVITDEAKKLLEGVTTIVLDGLRYEPHNTHFTIPQAIEVSKSLGIQNVFLTHMTHSISYKRDSAKLPEGVQFAYDGLEIEFFS